MFQSPALYVPPYVVPNGRNSGAEEIKSLADSQEMLVNRLNRLLTMYSTILVLPRFDCHPLT